MKTKVCIFSVYIGELPKYINYWKISAKFNKDYDWYVFTDSVKETTKEENITFIPIDLNKLINLVNLKLKTPEIKIQTLNRIADFKVMYADIFENISEQYDWWGWTDLDVIYGNFNEFLNDDIFSRYEIIGYISDNTKRLFGPFCLFSNKLKKLYTDITDYKKLISNGNMFYRNCACLIDEKGIYETIKEKNIKVFMKTNSNEYIIKNYKKRYPMFWNAGTLTLGNRDVEDYMKNTIIVHLKQDFKSIEDLDLNIPKFVLL